MNDDSGDHTLPLFLTDPNDAETPRASRIFIMAVVFVTAMAAGIGIVAVATRPAARLAAAAASLIGVSMPQPPQPPQPDARRPVSASSTTTAETPVPGEGPPRYDMAATSSPADVGAAATGAPSADGLLQRFQAWAADQDNRAQPLSALPVSAPPVPAPPAPDAEPAQSAESVQPAAEIPAPVEPSPPALVRAAPKPRSARSFQNARAEIRPARAARRPKVSHLLRASERPEPEEDARTPPPPPAQTGERPSLLQFLGLHN